ncbi:MAG: sulfotransferase family 2 domain-containing protein [Ilumatobacter sp.]
MPVYRHHRLAHLHIPKTAGTAIESQFAGLDDMQFDPTSFVGQITRADRCYELQHLTLNELRIESHHDVDALDIFAVVRNPYQRLVSEYFWRQSILERNPAAAMAGFESFTSLVEAIPLDMIHNWDRYIAFADAVHANLLIHLRPQSHYVCNLGGRLDPAVNIVRFEHLHEDLEPIYLRHDVATRLAQREQMPYRLSDFYNDASLSLVNRAYAHDFEWFGYERLDTVNT